MNDLLLQVIAENVRQSNEKQDNLLAQLVEINEALKTINQKLSDENN